jgi:hypothetical protein
MIIDDKKSGIFFKFEKQDWQADAYGFMREIKKLPGWQFNPPEKDDNWWYIPLVHKANFYNLKKKYIDRPLETERTLKKEDYKPIPRPGRFSQRKLKF